jgi:hypothetical protein
MYPASPNAACNRRYVSIRPRCSGTAAWAPCRPCLPDLSRQPQGRCEVGRSAVSRTCHGWLRDALRVARCVGCVVTHAATHLLGGRFLSFQGGARRRRFSVSAPRSTCRGRGGYVAAREREISRRDRFQTDRAVFPERWKMAQRRKRDVLPAIDAPARMHITCRRKCNVGTLHEYGPDLAQKGK